ncbi:methylenetetrahydrofolate reductase [Arthrobacter sp. FW306-05-C]|uniref:methylenetetrahydrofolate reductase n=1 Tax=unclassified Arthrobacter TaxID=235627 RepID=UPI001EF004D8|nr:MULTISPECIES: methylenetetrahydrofolate reductase [unclassified Arthrobacter]UKA66796.1 methylenetetrahydrofolate reductase [Arthrobacter sp. FW306-05-C]UKA75432.1 methylenetetrahydrofolate reductase [Arthrobacter sp. FW306-07-I]
MATRIMPAPNRAASLELIKNFSVEMTGKDIAALIEAKDKIPPGTRINVTFLGNEDLEMRVAAAKAVRDLGFVPVPHISARRLASRGDLEKFLQRLQEVGAAEHVFVVGGDPAEPEGPYGDSLALINTGLLPQFGVREVGIGGYPEGHPDIPKDTLWRAVEDKTAALAAQDLGAFIITQFAFDTGPVAGWIEEVRARGIKAPIRVGTPGPAGVKRLLSFARRFGVGANAMIVKKYGFSLTNLMGDAGPDRFVNDLAAVLAQHAPGQDQHLPPQLGLHFYTFGGLLATANWVRHFTAEDR